MTLSPEDRKAIIEYRIDRAHQAMEEAKYVANGKFWNLAANRLYYAVFYVCEALLLSIRVSTATHTGVSRMMNMHFVRTGKLSETDKNTLSRLFRMRQTGDYDDLYDWTEEEIMNEFPEVERLIHKIEDLIEYE